MEQLSITDARWQDFVRGRPDATPFHDPVWAALLRDSYRMPVFALVRRDATGEIVAGMPVAAAPRLPGRPKRLVSLPFTDHVAPLVTAGSSPALADEADIFRRERGYEELEVRASLPGAKRGAIVGVLHTLELSADPESLLSGLSKGKRRDVRAAERGNLTVRQAQDERDVTKVFYDLHLATRKRLGVPVQPKRFFRLLWSRVLATGRGYALIAEEAGTPLASAIFLIANDRLVYKYSASDVQRRSQLPTDLLLWRAICDGCERGLMLLDFGRSDLSANGLRAFKRRWGAAESPLVYTRLGAIEAAGGPTAPSALSAVLRRAPVAATRLVGELAYRYGA